MKYLRYFENLSDYFEASNLGKLNLPNMAFVNEGEAANYVYYLDNEETLDILNNYLTIVALEDNLEVSFSRNGLEYCKNGDGNWISLNSEDISRVNAGETLSFRGNLLSNGDGVGTFTISKKCNLSGNCNSILFGDKAHNKYELSEGHKFSGLFNRCSTIVSVSKTFLPATTLVESCYDSMFSGCSSLTKAPELPATILADWCYDSMFEGCTSLTIAPELPATTLSECCYLEMFYSCTSLTTPPKLPATTLAIDCYFNMFRECTSLTTPPQLPATVLADECYLGMFWNCTSLTTPPQLSATELTLRCYSGMFNGCTSLTTAPELPAMILAEECYNSMFFGCIKLSHIKMLAIDISANDCLYCWVKDVSSNGEFIKNSEMNDLPIASSSNSYSGIPEGWVIKNNEEITPIPEIKWLDFDLPSGTLWAAWNIGATNESEYGLRFAWGETEGYTKDQIGVDKNFNWNDYKFSINGEAKFSKYNEEDGLVTLLPEDDPATALWGEECHTPTLDQWEELCQYTTGDSVNINFTDATGAVIKRVPGRRFQRNNQTMYILGEYNEDGVNYGSTLWLSTIPSRYADSYEPNYEHASTGGIYNGGYSTIFTNDRCLGYYVRAVKFK